MPVFPPPYKTSDIFSVACLLVRSYVTERTEHFFKSLEQENMSQKP